MQADHYIPMEELRATKDERWQAMVEGRWGEFGGEEPDDVHAPASHATVDAIVARASRARPSSRCATAA